MMRCALQAYFCGHDHSLEHLYRSDTGVHYIVSGAGSRCDRGFGTATDSLFQWPYSGERRLCGFGTHYCYLPLVVLLTWMVPRILGSSLDHPWIIFGSSLDHQLSRCAPPHEQPRTMCASLIAAFLRDSVSQISDPRQ